MDKVSNNKRKVEEEKEVVKALSTPEMNSIYETRIFHSIRAIRSLKVDIVPDQIEEGLYLGCASAAHNKDDLKRLNIDELRAKLKRSIRALRHKVGKVPNQIEEGLYLGCVSAAHNKDELKRLNITHVLTVATALKPQHPNDFKYKVIEVRDRESTDLSQHFDDTANFIDEAKSTDGSVLVHCYAGRSRSVTIVVAYLMRKHGMSFTQALELVKSKRPQASPNYGFLKQLQKFEKTLEVYYPSDQGLI